MSKKEKLYAYPFGKAGTDGDSSWGGTRCYEYKEGMTTLELVDATFNGMVEEYEAEDNLVEQEEILEFTIADEEYDGLAGWWIITESTLKVITITSNAMPDAGNDSACYNQNETLKCIAKEMAIKTHRMKKLPAKYRKMVEALRAKNPD